MATRRKLPPFVWIRKAAMAGIEGNERRRNEHISLKKIGGRERKRERETNRAERSQDQAQYRVAKAFSCTLKT